MDDKLISIIMPAYKAASLIQETLESVKKQSYTHWELIVIEDFSDDGTKGILDEFKESVGQNVVYYRNEVNKGPAATRNIAASMAKGSWYAFLDSDDIWHKNHLLSLATTAQENPDHDLIYGAHLCFAETIESIFAVHGIYKGASENFPLAIYEQKSFNQKFYILPSASMLSLKAFTGVNGWDETLRGNEDTNLYFKLLQKGYRFKYTEKSTTYYRFNPNGLSKNFLKMSYDLARTYEDAIDWEEIPKKIRYKQTSDKWMIVARMSRKSDSRRAKAAVKKAVKYNLSFKTLFYFLLIYITSHKYLVDENPSKNNI